MSQRSSGRLNLAEMDEAPELPVVPLVQRAPEERPSLVTEQAPEPVRQVKTQKVLGISVSSTLKQLAEQKYKPKAEKVQHTIRFEPWLDELVRRQVLVLQMNGHRKLTKEVLVTAAVMEYLGVKEPPTD